jgi:hypothetical protein
MAPQSVIRSDFYVYALFREDGITPFYIGKGRGNRINVHDTEAPQGTYLKDQIIREMWRAGIDIIPRTKLIEGLTDGEAKSVERDLIALIGRRPVGPLANHTAGGDGVEALTGDGRARKSERNRASWADPKVRAKRLAGMRAAWTPEKRAAFAKRKRDAQTPEFREKLSRAQKKVVFTRRHPGPEKGAAQSAAMKKRWLDPDSRKKYSDASAKRQREPKAIEARRAVAKRMWAERREELLAKRRQTILQRSIARGVTAGEPDRLPPTK